jgi:hypothetical protein
MRRYLRLIRDHEQHAHPSDTADAPSQWRASNGHLIISGNGLVIRTPDTGRDPWIPLVSDASDLEPIVDYAES